MAYSDVPKDLLNLLLTPGKLIVANDKGMPVASDIGLSDIAAASQPSWTKYTVDYTMFSGATNNKSITLFSLPAKSVLQAVIIKHTTSFSGGLTYALFVGTASSNGKYINAFDVRQAVSDTAFGINSTYGMESFAPVNILVTANSGLGLLSGANAGVANIWIQTSTLP